MLKTTQTAFKASLGSTIVSNSRKSPGEPIESTRPPPASLLAHRVCYSWAAQINSAAPTPDSSFTQERFVLRFLQLQPRTISFVFFPGLFVFFRPRLFPTFLCYFWGDDKEAGTVFICSLRIRRRDGILKRTFLIGFHQADRHFKIRTKEADRATVWFFFPSQSLFVGQIKLKREKDGCYFPDGVMIALCAATRWWNLQLCPTSFRSLKRLWLTAAHLGKNCRAHILARNKHRT